MSKRTAAYNCLNDEDKKTYDLIMDQVTMGCFVSVPGADRVMETYEFPQNPLLDIGRDEGTRFWLRSDIQTAMDTLNQVIDIENQVRGE